MTAPLYRPPTRVVTTQIPYLALVTQADPEFERRKHREVEYEFSSRVFVADPYVRGSYNYHSNVYAVGQPFGANNPEIVDNVPLYSGIPTGSWA